MKSAKHKIVVIDDHAVVRFGVVNLISREADLVVVAEAGTAAAALQSIETHEPELAVVDLSLGEDNGMELINLLRIRHPKLLIIVLSMLSDEIYAETTLRAGAKGYVMKQQTMVDLLKAIREVLAGRIFASQEVKEKLMYHGLNGNRNSAPIDQLSEREKQVLQLIGEWRKTAEIAKELHLSIKTVEYYKAHLKDKLNLKDATELTRFATSIKSGK